MGTPLSWGCRRWPAGVLLSCRRSKAVTADLDGRGLQLATRCCGKAAVPGLASQGARWVLPSSGEPSAAGPAGTGVRWALPCRGDVSCFCCFSRFSLAFPNASAGRNPPNHLTELPTREREETAEREPRPGVAGCRNGTAPTLQSPLQPRSCGRGRKDKSVFLASSSSR